MKLSNGVKLARFPLQVHRRLRDSRVLGGIIGVAAPGDGESPGRWRFFRYFGAHQGACRALIPSGTGEITPSQ